MNKKEALRIAGNYYNYYTGNNADRIRLQNLDEERGTATVLVEEPEYGEDSVMEISIDLPANKIIAKRVLDCDLAADFLAETKTLSQLKPGDHFRTESNIIVYEYLGMDGPAYMFVRADRRWAPQKSRSDLKVYPCQNHPIQDHTLGFGSF